MNILIPVNPTDFHLLRPLMDVFLFLGSLTRHTVIFACAPSVHAQVSPIAAELTGRCAKVLCESLPREPEGTGFTPANMTFRDAIDLMPKLGISGVTFWFELDGTPILAGWADRLELEYNRKGMPFLGVVREVSEVLRDAAGQPTGEGKYMVGFGIYPENFRERSTLYRFPDPRGAMPFDVSIRFEVAPHAHHTNLIEHRYRTGNYQLKDGKITCEDHEHREGYPRYGGEIGEMAFVVHGCKDSSLANIVLQGEKPENRPVESSPIVSENSEILVLKSQIKALTEQNDQLRQEIARLSQSKTEPVKPKQETPEDDLAEPPALTVDLILKTWGNRKGIQLGTLAADLKFPNKPALREFLVTNGFEVEKSPLAWCKKPAMLASA